MCRYNLIMAYVLREEHAMSFAFKYNNSLCPTRVESGARSFVKIKSIFSTNKYFKVENICLHNVCVCACVHGMPSFACRTGILWLRLSYEHKYFREERQFKLKKKMG